VADILASIQNGKLFLGRIRILSFCLGVAFGAPAGADPFSFESLRELITVRGIASVEELVEALPIDLRTHYTLVFASRSLQSATPANPRAILYGADATLIITFNGEPAERGYASVETMAFDPLTNAFQFREIQFSAVPGAKASISETNPARCVACHGRPGRPIWDTLPMWPGVYGERYGAGLSAPEAKGIREFLALQPQHARYRYLVGASAFADRETYVTGARIAYNGVKTRPPNAQLSELLTTLNIRSILSEVVSHPAFNAHRYLLVAASEHDCGPLTEFYPKALRSSVAADLGEFERMSAATQRRQAAMKVSRLVTVRHLSQGGVAAESFNKLRFVAEHDLGITSQQWTLALEHNSFDLTAPEDSLTLAQAVFNWVAVSDPALLDLRSYRGYSNNDGYCKYLRRASLAALDGWYQAHPIPEHRTADARVEIPSALAIPRQPENLDRCVACHTGEIGPAIPFDNPDNLAQSLVHGDYPRGRLLDEILFRLSLEAGSDSMPRGMTIDAGQRRALEEYFLAVAARGTGHDGP